MTRRHTNSRAAASGVAGLSGIRAVSGVRSAPCVGDLSRAGDQSRKAQRHFGTSQRSLLPPFEGGIEPGSRREPVEYRVRRAGYILLETVVATGLLIVGLAVIGAQVQSADTSVRTMDRELRAMMFAEQQLAELDLGLIELESLDEVEDGDFGSRQPDWAWRMTTEPTVVEGLFRLRIDVFYHHREDDYSQDSFDYDAAEMMFTAYAFRAAPRSIDFAADYGLNEEEFDELSKKFVDLGIPIDPSNFSPGADMLDRPFDELIEILPLVMEAMGLDFDQLAAVLPKDVVDQIRDSGVLGDDTNNGDGADNGDGRGRLNNGPNNGAER